MARKYSNMFRMFLTRIYHLPSKDFRLLESKNNYTVLYRLNSSADTITSEDTNKKDTNEQTVVRRINSEILQKLQAIGPIDLENLPNCTLQRKKNIDIMYLLDKTSAKTYASMIVEDLKKFNSFILEINPGLGLLTEELVQAGIGPIHLYEQTLEFRSSLENLVEKYPNQLELRPYNFLNISKIEYIDKRIGKNHIKKIFEGVEKRKWSDEPSMAIIGTIPSLRYLISWQISLMNSSLSNYGRFVLYVAISPSMSVVFEKNASIKALKTPKNIFLNILFNYKQLGTLPRNVFFPWSFKELKKKKRKSLCAKDNELMHIVELSLKPNFITDDFTRHDAEMFFYFLQIHLRRRDTRVIPALEKWIPGCGPRLIKMNFTIYTEFSEIPTPMLLELFKIFKSWPEYETSPFVSCVEAIIERQNYNK